MRHGVRRRIGSSVRRIYGPRRRNLEYIRVDHVDPDGHSVQCASASEPAGDHAHEPAGDAAQSAGDASPRYPATGHDTEHPHCAPSHDDDAVVVERADEQ